mmetsp:Transcript_33404/g.30394  ORF Transcript_33404/g.30394 Transcript_33404/m.30394 type:complete len:86 (-) Transcript_33404:310-567(-)
MLFSLRMKKILLPAESGEFRQSKQIFINFLKETKAFIAKHRRVTDKYYVETVHIACAYFWEIADNIEKGCEIGKQYAQKVFSDQA